MQLYRFNATTNKTRQRCKRAVQCIGSISNSQYSQTDERCSPSKSTTPVSMVSSVQEEYIRSFSLTKRFFDDLDAAANRNR